MQHAQVIHVNADHPEYVDFAFDLAVDYRMKFKKDVFVDIIGYRKFGHNEQDNPNFTQPWMYEQIKNKIPMWKMHCNKQVKEGFLTQAQIDERKKNIYDKIMDGYDKAMDPNRVFKEKDSEVNDSDSKWGNLLSKPEFPYTGVSTDYEFNETNISEKVLKQLNEKVNVLPDKPFKFHKTITKTYKQRYDSIVNGTGIDWATAENMAYASLQDEGFGVRLSGEDVQRGTFSHRHCVLWNMDRTTNKDQLSYTPLYNAVNNGNPHIKFQAYNSLLSEYGVLGFDYGYSCGAPNTLTIWEAQFGDFANVCQPVIDLMIGSGERKWLLYLFTYQRAKKNLKYDFLRFIDF